MASHLLHSQTFNKKLNLNCTIKLIIVVKIIHSKIVTLTLIQLLVVVKTYTTVSSCENYTFKSCNSCTYTIVTICIMV